MGAWKGDPPPSPPSMDIYDPGTTDPTPKRTLITGQRISPRRELWSQDNRSHPEEKFFQWTKDPTLKKIMSGRWGSKGERWERPRVRVDLDLRSTWGHDLKVDPPTTSTLTILWPVGFAPGKNVNLFKKDILWECNGFFFSPPSRSWAWRSLAWPGPTF